MGTKHFHVTAIRNGGVYGHGVHTCDAAGCAGSERYLGPEPDFDDEVEVGEVYEIVGGKVVALVVDEDTSKAAAALGRKGGAAGRGATKKRGDAQYYRDLVAKRKDRQNHSKP